MIEGRRDPEADARISTREALRFLLRAGRILSSSLDPDQTLRRVVRLAVPRVACFAMIDLARDDGRMQRVAYIHVDDAKAPLLERREPFDPVEEGLVPLARVFEEGNALLVEDVERDWDGSPEILENIRLLGGRSLIIVPLAGAGGEVLGTLTFGSTRTDRFYHRTDLSLAGELGRSAALALENARLYRGAEQAIAARDEVLGIVSHDLRNPLNRVRLGAEMLRNADELPDGADRMLGMIVRAADEMNRLIGDLLDVTSIEAGRLSIEPASVSLAHLLERIEESHAAAARERGVNWLVEPPLDESTFHADEGRLLQALGNLIDNALKFTPGGGTVRVTAARAGNDAVRIGVIDTGPGMDGAQVAHVFDRFWQARRGDRRGAGLGLAITRGIVDAHGGRLWLESAPGRGTEAWLELPLST
jgi:signal transduction histidine kinase